MARKRKIIRINFMVFIVAIILVLVIVGIRLTMARYASQGASTIDTGIAFYVVKDTYQTGNILLKDLYPSTDSFDYEFTVTNKEGENVAETTIDYTIELEITTNLPLEFAIYRNNDELDATSIENTIELDASNQYYIRKIKIKDGQFIYDQEKTDTYKIEVNFPIDYNENEEYEGLIDNVNIILDAKQKIE